jgi:hypothetical protein
VAFHRHSLRPNRREYHQGNLPDSQLLNRPVNLRASQRDYLPHNRRFSRRFTHQASLLRSHLPNRLSRPLSLRHSHQGDRLACQPRSLRACLRVNRRGSRQEIRHPSQPANQPEFRLDSPPERPAHSQVRGHQGNQPASLLSRRHNQRPNRVGFQRGSQQGSRLVLRLCSPQVSQQGNRQVNLRDNRPASLRVNQLVNRRASQQYSRQVNRVRNPVGSPLHSQQDSLRGSLLHSHPSNLLSNRLLAQARNHRASPRIQRPNQQVNLLDSLPADPHHNHRGSRHRIPHLSRRVSRRHNPQVNRLANLQHSQPDCRADSLPASHLDSQRVSRLDSQLISHLVILVDNQAVDRRWFRVGSQLHNLLGNQLRVRPAGQRDNRRHNPLVLLPASLPLSQQLNQAVGQLARQPGSLRVVRRANRAPILR